MTRIRALGRISPGGMLVGVALVLLSISSVQLGGAIAKTLFDRIDPASLTFVRLALGALVVVAVARPRVRSWSPAAWRSVVWLGLTLAAMNLLFYLSLPRIPIALAVGLELLGPLVLALVQSRRVVDLAWVAVAAVGVGLIAAQSLTGALDPVGVALALGAGACWAVYILASASVGRHVPGLGGLAGALVIGSLAVAPVGAAGALAAVRADPTLLAPAFATAMLSSAVAYGFELLALRRVPTRVFGVLMAIEPAAAALFGFLIIGEALSPLDLLALLLVAIAAAGVAATAARASRRRRAHDGPGDPVTMPLP